MDKTNKIILVAGATGQQGGAVVEHLLKDGWTLRGLTRNIESDKAKALAAKGVELMQGEFDDRPSLDAALEDVYGVYSVQGVVPNETEQGVAFADAALAAGVKHFVYASVGGAERKTGVPHFETKWAVEEYLTTLDMPTTILRPAFFMENFNWKRDGVLNGSFESNGMEPDRPLQMIAATDIGAFAAIAFADPETYIGQAVEIAGDELSERQFVEVIASVVGKPVSLDPLSAPHAYGDMTTMFKWFDTDGYEADIPVLRVAHPELLNFEGWLRSTGWAG